MSRASGRVGRSVDWGQDDTGASILHVDMDAFFAAVELIDRPDLHGEPVIVGGHHRGVVLSATYEARAFGVHSAMPMTRARRMAPQAWVIPPDHERYRQISHSLMQILGEVTPVLEQVSIDEAFLDVSGARRRVGSASHIGQLLRDRIAEQLGVVASVGIASTKFVAKLASQHAKPNGMLLIPAAAAVDFLHSLPVGALWGVGQRTEETLARAGVTTVADVAHAPLPQLDHLLGRRGASRLHDLAWGRDPRPVEPVREEKSIGHEQTFEVDLLDLEALASTLLDQAHRCASRLRAAELLTQVISIKVRLSDFTTLTRARTLPAPTDIAQEIFAAAKELLAGVAQLSRGVRLLGVRCESLHQTGNVAIQAAFDDPGPERREAERTMDEVHARFGSQAMRVGSLVHAPATRNAKGELS